MKTPLSAFQHDPSVSFTLTLAAVRHGAKQGSPVPNDDALLTELGEAQVAATGRMLSESFGRVVPSLVLSSNLPRAKQTAEILARELAHGRYVVHATAGFGYQRLERMLQAENAMINAIAGEAQYANATASQMAELIPNWAVQSQVQMMGALASTLNSFSGPDSTGSRLPDGSLLGVLGNHSPMLEFLPDQADWSRITKRGPASGITIPVVVYYDGRVEVIPGAECFDAGLVAS